MQTYKVVPQTKRETVFLLNVIINGVTDSTTQVFQQNTFEVDKWYIFVMTLTRDVRSNELTQAVNVVALPPIDLTIQ